MSVAKLTVCTLRGSTATSLITASSATRSSFTIPHYDSTGTLLGVTGVDISVLDLSYYLGAMQVTEHSRLFITDATDHLVALQMRDPKKADRLFRKKLNKMGYDVLKATDLGDPVLSAVVDAYRQRNDSKIGR